MVAQLDFLLRPGLPGVLLGLAQHGFVLGLLLILTARSRTVSLPTLGIFWMLDAYTVFLLAYLIQAPMGQLFGTESSNTVVRGTLIQTSDTFVPVYWAPFVEEALKLAPVAAFLLLACRGGRQPSMTDGLLLGFMVGAGVTFHEDAHVAKVFTSSRDWDAGMPWTAILPTAQPVGDLFILLHALWTALSGLTIGVAVMFRHRRWAWAIAFIGPLLSLSNHMMGNHFAGNILGQLGRADVPWLFSTIRSLTNDGKLPMLVLIFGGLAVAVGDWLILRWVGKRDRMFLPLSAAYVYSLVKKANSRAGATQLIAAERYLRLRRTVYFAGWRRKVAGGSPEVSYADFARLTDLLARAGPLPQAAPPEPEPPQLADSHRTG
jgi:RsiW-degrading membrane proteinase PrsW (M82 family)